MIHGAGRFAGYGNVQVTQDRTHRGWQLTCTECGALSTIIHRGGQSYPPKVLFHMFREMSWKVGSSSKNDVCPECQKKLREQRRQERKQYVNGSVNRLLDAIRQLDRLIASSVTVDYGDHVPEIEAQLRSLFETAYLCNIFPHGMLGEFKNFFVDADEEGTFNDDAPVMSNPVELEPEPLPPHLSEEPESTPPESTLPPSPPVQAPVPQEGHRMSPRTAEFLAETRRKISQLRNREHDNAAH